MKKFDIDKDVNYFHFVGEIQDLKYIENPDGSAYMKCVLKIQTAFRDNIHKPISVNLVFWDKLAFRLNELNLFSVSRDGVGDKLNIEGRVTVRNDEVSFTGNKVKVLRKIEGKESFLEQV